MRKTFVLIIVVFFISGIVMAENSFRQKSVITISNPTQNTVWKTGKSYNINWALNGSNSSMTILLIQHLETLARPKIITITEKTNNDGNFVWTVPKNLKSGKYFVRIRTLNGKVEGDSKIFKIERFILVNDVFLDKILFMKVLKPDYGSYWDMGKTYKIKWDTNAKGLIHINLYTYNKNFVRSIATGPKLTNGKQYPWPIPSDLNIGKYKIKISTLDNKVSEFSEKFTIRGSLTTNKYTVPVVFTSNKRKTIRKADDTNMDCPSHVDPGPKKMRVGHATLATENLTCKTFYRSYAYFDLTSFAGKGFLKKASIVTTKIAGGQYGGAYPNVLDEKWNGNALALFNVKTHRETSTSSGYGNESWRKFTNTVRSWIAYPDLNYGVVFTVFNEDGLQSGWNSIRHYTVRLELEFVEAE